MVVFDDECVLMSWIVDRFSELMNVSILISSFEKACRSLTSAPRLPIRDY